MAKPYDNEELFAPITHLTNRYNEDTKTMKGVIFNPVEEFIIER